MNTKSALILFVVSALLASCGRRSAPEQIEPSGYPHQYPASVTEDINVPQS